MSGDEWMRLFGVTWIRWDIHEEQLSNLRAEIEKAERQREEILARHNRLLRHNAELIAGAHSPRLDEIPIAGEE